MTITMEPMDALTEFNGVKVRPWKGKTDKGTPVIVMVRGLCVPESEDQAAFKAEMIEIMPKELATTPLADVLAIPLAKLV